MDHAEANARLMDLVLEPARLRGLDRDMSAGSSELRAHIATCADCRGELDAWRATVAALDGAVTTAPIDGDLRAASLGDLADSAVDAALPEGLRARILGAPRELTGPRVHHVAPSRRPMRIPSWLALAAALVVLIGGTAVVVNRTQQLDQARAQTAAINTVAAGLDHILQDPGHRVAQLVTPSGAPAGSVSWSASQSSIVVITDALANPPAGQVYRCWVSQGASGVVVGEMQFSGSIAYWAGSLDAWSATFVPGGKFWVSLEPVSGGSKGTRVLSGTL
jgi:uncharacterized protein YidB (DUF937 family)